MAFLSEDGTGISNANSFVTVAYADLYYADRLNLVWAALTTAQKESYLIQATSYIDSVYGLDFKGTTSFDTQSLCFPRTIDSVLTYPNKLLQATCELALKAKTAPLLSDTGAKVLERTVGPLTTKYSEYGSTQTQYDFVYRLLSPYLDGSNQSRKVVRT